jgi:hypothetical protein
MLPMDLRKKEKIDAIPSHIKEKYVPILRKHFKKVSRAMVQPCNDSDTAPSDFDTLLIKAKEINSDFKKDGGHTAQWNILSMAIHTGQYDRIYPSKAIKAIDYVLNKLGL